MFTLSSKGDWKKTDHFFDKIKRGNHNKVLTEFGQRGVEVLSSATPVDSGKTAASWRYEIENSSDGLVISFHNDNLETGVNIALILNYGHGTGTGGWVEGRDFINPAIQPVFDEMAEELWKEVVG